VSDSEEEEKHERFEGQKVLDTSLFNYSIYLAQPLTEGGGGHSEDETAETLVDDELRRLIAEHKRV